MFEMDISRLLLLQMSDYSNLKNENYMEKLLIKLGFNYEIPEENPQIIRDNVGGLLMWQYPNQFSKFLVFLSKFKIHSYMEIGVRTGGTFLTVCSYLEKMNPKFKRSIAIDINETPLTKFIEMCKPNHSMEFHQMDSKSEEFHEFSKNNPVDCVFIDGDHSYEGVKNDFACIQETAKIICIHDIYNDLCPDIMVYWNELKNTMYEKYDFYEFIEQYTDVVQRTKQRHMGIGVMVQRGI